MKRIAAVQDISCVGRCSLTVALPIISAMGVEACPLPTALLSTHTLFPEPYVRDLTDMIAGITEHWKKIGAAFDGIYTGYLGSLRQIEVISRFIDEFRGEGFVFIDPVMGDHGRLYSGFSPEYVGRMAEFCGKGDIIVPNLTEACFMLGRDYIGEKYDRDDIKGVLRELTGLGASKAILTGVSLEPGRLGAAAYDSGSGEYFLCMGDRVQGSFHGTGDIFASVCVGALAKGEALGLAVERAVNFTCESIKATTDDLPDRRFGVNFEKVLHILSSEE
ncbi:MAG: pyridoxamine kinase [Clostridia bacterium]|nr:pyridoxamine kinase [Clostridia bacterium]